MMTNDDTSAWSDLPVSPGSVLEEELEARGMTRDELAERMGRSIHSVEGILRGEDALTHESALELETAIGIPAQFWLNMESAYRMTLERNANRAVLDSRTEEITTFSR